MTFTQALTTELKKLSDLTPDGVEEALTRAANHVLDERDDPDAFRLTRYVAPEDFVTLTKLEDVHGGEYVWLSAAEVALLRALLMTWDETVSPRAGDPYLLPVQTRDGTRHCTYQPEHEEE